ncbi:hypothetical protein GCM10022255_085700 [Dactylosporangium darangshiense]|uniref:Uncharacterized protein n=2 Tax=Dactylosporangium darangshiense TaxID=579108 RepID=A0ABP8DML6_9ACTN
MRLYVNSPVPGMKIQAVKMYREITGADLTMGVREVEAMADDATSDADTVTGLEQRWRSASGRAAGGPGAGRPRTAHQLSSGRTLLVGPHPAASPGRILRCCARNSSGGCGTEAASTG